MQSIAVITIRGDLDCVASSKGKKYFSASKLPAFDLGRGKQDEAFDSPLKKINNYDTLLTKILIVWLQINAWIYIYKLGNAQIWLHLTTSGKICEQVFFNEIEQVNTNF